LNTILVVTSKLDPHTDAVISSLSDRGWRTFRLNTDDVESEYAFLFNENYFLIRDSLGREISTKSGRIVGYFRKPRQRSTTNGSAAERLIASEFNGILNGLYCHPQVSWINARLENQGAQSKLGQLSTARKLGFTLPRTLITNDAEEAISFCSTLSGDVAIKPVATPSIADESSSHHFFTKKIATGELREQLRQVELCPVILQEYIPKQYELRITIIGDSTFCCRLDSQWTDGADADWRAVDPDKIEHEIIAIDPEIEQLCRSMMRHYHLEFGAFDFIVTSKGSHVFLELNPNGQWYWIEILTGAPMADAMADCLIKRAEKIENIE